ncbi:MAG: hypothetical protein ACAI34_12745 [Verrucomicrobium sp.]
MRFESSPLLLTLLMGVLTWLPGTGGTLQGADTPALVVEFGGLKNLYRVVFTEFDEANSFAKGALEIYSEDDTEVPELKVPFAAELKADPKEKNKKVETLEVRCTALLAFFPPADPKEPYPTLTWKLTGRKTGKAKLTAKLWDYDSKKSMWATVNLELEQVAVKAGEK